MTSKVAKAARDRGLVLLGLLVVVAVVQTYLSQTTILSPWKGGGFGMYSAPHPTQLRAIFVEVEGRPPIRVTPRETERASHEWEMLEHRANLLLGFPSARRLRGLAQLASPLLGGECITAIATEVRYVPREGRFDNQVLARGSSCD